MPKDVTSIGSTKAQQLFDLPVSLQAGQVNTLSFSQESISTMQLTPKGELEISFRDGSRLVIENFEELVNSSQSCGRDTLIQLSDNTIIYPEELQEQLAQGPVQFGNSESGIIALSEPLAGQVIETNIEPGHEYQMGFDLSQVSAAQAGQNLILSFPNGGVLILNNYFAAAHTELPPVMTLADGAVVDASALLTSCKLVEIPSVAETVVAAVPPAASNLRDIEPAAGEPEVAPAPTPSAAQKIAQVEPAAGDDFANIEPAAGDAGGSPVSSSRGYGFNSSIDGASFGGEDPIGPIAPTALNYNAPTIPTIPYVSGQAGTPASFIPQDDRPVVGSAETVVDETNLGTAMGTVVVDYGNDGPGVLSFNDSFGFGGSVGPELKSCEFPVVVTHTGDTYTGTANGSVVFTLVIDPATGDYSFTQFGPLSHADATNSDDVISLTFGVTATDADGDATNTTITVHVHDDGPVAVDDSVSVGSDPFHVTGNVLTNDDAGTDGDGHVTSVEFNGVSYAVPAVGFVSVVGNFGVLELAADGSYIYTSYNAALGTDQFVYTMADCDGDTDTAILAVEVTDLDVQPTVQASSATLDETNLSGVNSVSGAVVADFGVDGPGSYAFNSGNSSGGSLAGGALTSNGVPVVVSLVGSQYVGMAGGDVVFTLTLDPVSGGYTFTQFKPLDHADGTNPNDSISLTFGVTATDADGDAVSTTVTINVLDDAPIAVDDGQIVPHNVLTVTGNVTTNDDVGEDVPGYVVNTISFNGADYAVPAVGTVTINGVYGVLEIGSNGSYSYTSFNTALGSDEFIYTIEDQDGDTSSAKLTLTVSDINTTPTLDVVPEVVDETLVDESGLQTVTGTVVVDFGADGPGTVALAGAPGFSATGSVAGGSLTSNGVPVVVTQVGNQYVGTAGGETIFELTLNPDNSYEFVLHGQLDHADATNPDDVITLNFGVVATDADGDTAVGTIKINVHDDAPVAVNDNVTIVDPSVSVSGNVTDNDDIGEDIPGFIVSEVEFNGTSYAIAQGGTVTINGTYGVLVIGSDGAYTYTSNNTAIGADQFVYTIKDQDGDPASATLTFTVKDIDQQPSIENEFLTVDETIVDNAGLQTVNGTLTYDFFGDGPGTINPVAGSFASGGSLKNGALTSNGVAVVVTLAGDTYTGKAGATTIFTLTINDDGSYSYKQFGQLDHADATNPDDVITLNFGFVATDADGDTANGTVVVAVHDDAPVAVNDVATLSQAPGSVSGNVTSNDDIGEDEPGYMVKEISFGGNTVGVPAAGSVTIAGAHGSLTIKADGSYTYTGSSVGADQFTYTIVDQDGDPASATLTVTVSDIDEQPCVENEFLTVDETIVDNAGSQTVNGTLTYDFFGDGPGTINPVAGSFASGGSLKNGALTSNGVAVVVTLAGDTYTGKAGATTIFTLTINDDGSYSYKQFGQLDHADATNPDDVITLNFGFVATDADGDTANGTVVVAVHDDAPVAVNDVATLSQAPGSVSGNVTSNDDIGEDEPGYMVKEISFGGNTVGVPAAGSVTIAGDHGSLTIKADGSYTYTGSTVGADQFTYTIVDQDGDPASATLTVTVSDIDEQPCVENEFIKVDETIVDNAGSQTVNGTLTYDFLGDGPGTINPVAGSFASGGSLKNGALTSNGVAVIVTLVGDTYTGKAGATTIFTLTINDDGSYSYKQFGQLDHADATNPDDVITLNFGFVATDADGDTANGTVVVAVHDDAPVAVNDVATLSQAPGSVSGNVTTNDDIGEDEPGYMVKEISFGGTTVGVPAAGSVTIAGDHGSLTIKADGSYTYTGSTVGADQFTYTIVDQDGDPASATLTVTVARVDQEPTVINSVKAIDETDLGPIVVNGSVNPDYHGDGPGVVTARPVSEIVVSGNAQGGVLSSSGVPVVIALVGNTYIGTAGGKDVFTLTVNADGTYQFTLLDNLDHSIATNHDETLFITFGVTATDADGDSVNGTIKIGIDDDGPVAVDDFASVPASQSTVSGDVDLNDDIGADFTADGVAFVKFGTTTYTVPVGGTVSINGAYGALVIGSNGEYTYTVNPGTTGGQEVFTYTLRDTDQDTATANLVIDVAPRYLPPEPPSVETCDLCVYEDGHAQIQVSTSANGGNGNEVITLSISGFAAGWVVDTSLSGGVYNSATGVWSITLGAGQSFSGGPVVYPPHDSDVDLTNLVVTSSVYDPDSGLTAIANGSFDIIVDAVADQPDLDLHDVFAVGSTFVALQVDVAVTDLDGSEEIKEIRIEGLPDGFSLNQGVYDAGAGRWVLSEDQLNDLQIMAPDGYEGQFTLLVTAVSEEVNLSGEECTTSNNIAYKADVVTVTLYDGACDCYCPPTSTTVITINNTVTVNSFDETIIDGTRSTSTSESSSSSSSTTVVTSTSGGDGSSGFQPIVISDFNKDEGDILDLGGLIDVLDGTSVAIQDFVTSRVENGNTIISMDADGAGGNYIAQDVVVLQGVSDVSVEDVVRLTGHEQNQSGFGTV